MSATVSILIPRTDKGYEAAMQACEREISERRRQKDLRCHRYRRILHGCWFIAGIALLAVLVFVLLQGSYPKLELHDCLIFAVGATFTFVAYHLYKVDWHHRRIK